MKSKQDTVRKIIKEVITEVSAMYPDAEETELLWGFKPLTLGQIVNAAGGEEAAQVRFEDADGHHVAVKGVYWVEPDETTKQPYLLLKL